MLALHIENMLLCKGLKQIFKMDIKSLKQNGKYVEKVIVLKNESW